MFFAVFLQICFKDTHFVASHNKCRSATIAFHFPTHGNMSLRHRKKRSWDKIDVDAENKFVRDSNSATSFENMILSCCERKCSLRNFLQDMFEVWLDGGPVPILAQGPPVLDLFSFCERARSHAAQCGLHLRLPIWMECCDSMV